MTLPEIAETLEGAIRILEDEAGERKNPNVIYAGQKIYY